MGPWNYGKIGLVIIQFEVLVSSGYLGTYLQ